MFYTEFGNGICELSNRDINYNDKVFELYGNNGEVFGYVLCDEAEKIGWRKFAEYLGVKVTEGNGHIVLNDFDIDLAVYDEPDCWNVYEEYEIACKAN